MPRSRLMLLVIFLCCTLLLTGLNSAHAQQAKDAGTVPASEATDTYYYLATTAGAVGGLLAGALITDGLIVPGYVWATSSSWWTSTAVAGRMAGGAIGGGGAAATAAAPPAAYAWSNLHYPIVMTIRWVGRVGGAVTGGLWAANWYGSSSETSAGAQ